MATVDESLRFLRSLELYAYDHGYHECGYDPVATVRDEIVRLRGAAEETRKALDAERARVERVREVMYKRSDGERSSGQVALWRLERALADQIALWRLEPERAETPWRTAAEAQPAAPVDCAVRALDESIAAQRGHGWVSYGVPTEPPALATLADLAAMRREILLAVADAWADPRDDFSNTLRARAGQ